MLGKNDVCKGVKEIDYTKWVLSMISIEYRRDCPPRGFSLLSQCGSKDARR
jgi:hypothetical protein